MLIPFRKMATWSELPPRTLMSVWAPMSPLWRTSTPAMVLRMSLTLTAGRDAMAALSSTETILALRDNVTGTLEDVTETESM